MKIVSPDIDGAGVNSIDLCLLLLPVGQKFHFPSQGALCSGQRILVFFEGSDKAGNANVNANHRRRRMNWIFDLTLGLEADVWFDGFPDDTPNKRMDFAASLYSLAKHQLGLSD